MDFLVVWLLLKASDFFFITETETLNYPNKNKKDIQIPHQLNIHHVEWKQANQKKLIKRSN